MAVKLISGPATSALALADVKARLKVEHDEDDAVLAAFITATIGYAERFTGRAFIDQTWDLYLDAFPADQIRLPNPPLIAVVGVFYLDSAGVEQEMSVADYVADLASEPGRVVLVANGTWPTAALQANAVRVRYRAGYLDQGVSPAVAAVPEDLDQAMFLRVKADYDGGDRAESLRAVAEDMLRQRRVHTSLA